MNIGIDARWIFPRISGIGRVTEKLIQHLGEIDGENRYYLFFEREELKEKYRRRWERHLNLEPVLVPWPLFSPISQLAFPRFLRRFDLDVFHSPNYLLPLLLRGPRVVVTIHDLIPFKFPHFTPRAKKTRFHFAFRWVLRRCVRKADQVIAVSRRTRQDVMDCLGLKSEKIAVVYNGVNDGYRPLDPEIVAPLLREKFGLSGNYILFVGRFDPYKNVVGLIRAYQKFREETGADRKLVIAGHRDPRYPEALEEVKALGLFSEVVFLDGLDEDDLLYLYNGALVLAFPSFYEGFGLPPLEAMACGIPVICSDRGALPEVVGDAALMVDPDEEESIARALRRIHADRGLRGELKKKGLERAKKFSWRHTAEETLNVYKRLVEAGGTKWS